MMTRGEAVVQLFIYQFYSVSRRFDAFCIDQFMGLPPLVRQNTTPMWAGGMAERGRYWVEQIPALSGAQVRGPPGGPARSSRMIVRVECGWTWRMFTLIGWELFVSGC